MPLFSYTAHNSSGGEVSGQIHASSLSEAREEVSKMDLEIEEVHEATIAEVESIPEPPSSISVGVQGNRRTGEQERTYLPLHETLRLYAGWLLAWYCLVYALGGYQHLRPLPFRFPLAEGLFLSPLVRSFTLAAFLYLLLGTIHDWWGGGMKKGLLFAFIGVLLFGWYGMNVG